MIDEIWPAGAVHRVHGEQEDRPLRHVHAEHERNGESDGQTTANTGRSAHDQADHDGDEHEAHRLRIGQQPDQRAEHHVDHEPAGPQVCFPTLTH
jgi:hypothetical protein